MEAVVIECAVYSFAVVGAVVMLFVLAFFATAGILSLMDLVFG